MLEIVNTVAELVGYVVLSVVALALVSGALLKRAEEREVSDEARQMAKEVDPNNPVGEDATAFVIQNILDGVRDMQRGETIRADPEPLIYFDWSTCAATQEDIEHILDTLQRAGYHAHPLPDHNTWEDKATWSRERAGIWHSEPDWHIVEFYDDGSKEIKEQVDLPLPEQWEQEVG